MTLVAVCISLAVLLTALRLSRIQRDRSLDDEDKERMIQQRAVALLRRGALMTATSIALLAAPLLVLAAFHSLGLAPLGDSLGLLGRWQTIAIATMLTLAVWLIRR